MKPSKKRHFIKLVLPDGSERMVGREIRPPRNRNIIGKAGAALFIASLALLASALWSLL